MAQELETKELLEKVAKSITDVQTAQTELQKGNAGTSEQVKKLADEAGILSQNFQDVTTRLEAEVKARESLELAMARIGENRNTNSDIKSDPVYANAFSHYLRYKTAIGQEPVESEFKNLVENTGVKINDSQMQSLKTLFVGSNPDGGAWVPVDVQSRIITRLYETSAMRNLATVITTASDKVEYPVDDEDGFDAGWVGEMETRNDTDNSKFSLVDIPIAELFAQPVATQKMLDDAMFNIESWLSQKVIDKIARTENTAFVSGDGIKKPRGINDYENWTAVDQYERGKLETLPTSTALAIVAADLFSVQGALLEQYQSGAAFAMHRKIWTDVIQLQDGQNQYLFNPMMLFQGTLGMQILGKPVSLLGDLPFSKVEDDIPLWYGNFKEGYVIADRIGIRVIRDNVTKKGFVKFYTTKRTGGGVVNFQAIKRLQILGS